jgi:trigger factor
LLNLTEEKIGPCLVALQVDVEPVRVESAMHLAAGRIARSVRIPGFRTGKAPYAVVLRAYGQQAVLAEAVRELGDEILKEALNQQGIEAYDNPSVEIASPEPLKLKFTIPVKPSVDLGAYRALRTPVQAPEAVDDVRLNQALEQVRKAQATHAPTERPAQLGDLVRLDFKIDDGDKNVLDRKDSERQLEAGAGDVAPGFSEALVGMAMGETRNFELAVPSDYAVADLAGHTLKVVATVHDIKEVQLPPVDDELAKSDGRFETLAELKADLRKNLEENAARVERERYESEVLLTAVEGAKIEFPDAMVEEELKQSLNELARSVTQQGFTFENWLRMNDTSLSGLRASMRPGVEERLRNTLFLYNLAEREGIKVEAEDIEASIAEEIARYPAELHPQLKEIYAKEDARLSLALRLLHRRALDKLVSIAKGEGILLPADAEPASRPSEVLVAH